MRSIVIIVTIHCSLVCAQDGSLMQGLLTIFFFSWNSTVECYDPAKNEWKFVTSMNNQRDGACVVTEGRYIYVISGYDGHSYLSSVEMYDPSTDDWALGGKTTSF